MSATGPTAIVAGGGIGGLTSAVALAQAGWGVTVLEQAAELREVGAGVALSRNAVAALEALGFDDDALADLGPVTRPAGTWDLHGRPLLRIPDSIPDVTLRGVLRPRLHTALLERARRHGVEIVTGARVTDVDPGTPDGRPAGVSVGPEMLRADLVVAADGVRSAVRRALFPATVPVYSGFSSWRGVVRGAVAPSALRQYWGPRAEFGYMPVGPQETYWYGYVRLPRGLEVADELATVRARFAGWAAPVRAVLDATEPAAVLRHDVLHLGRGVPRYALGRVVLVGDAAHATLPTMGQGAATALEDGVCVGRLVGAPVARGGRLGAALATYDAARRPRCRAIGRASVLSGRFGAHLGPALQGPRNLLVRLAPPASISRGAAAVMGWTPPA
jgi:2-polyprenyl-6-methoxyphenol hydroxylase-like FAD-dependent oxidoreductase